MDDLLRRVRERLGDGTSAPERSDTTAWPILDVLQPEEPYERAVASIQSLLREAESLHGLLSAEYVKTLTAEQHHHLLTVLNTVMQELWSSEVTLRRAGLYE
jgi:hypothetical protein